MEPDDQDETQQPVADSQHALAVSIAKAIQSGLPGHDSHVDVTESVRQALHAESRRTERTLAGVRVAFLAGLLALNVAAPVLVSGFPWVNTAVAASWLGLGTALLLALRRGWYRPWLRRAIPLADGLVIATSFALIRRSYLANWDSWEVGVVGGVAAACLLIAFSGSLRLSRHAAQFSTGVAVITWIAIALVDGAAPVAVVFIAAMILAIGVLGMRFTRVVRRVVTNEIARLRLTRMYEDARKAVAAREEVLQVVSHDLRNPLNTIAMATDLMLDLDPTPEQRVKHLGLIKRSGELMGHLIRDLLDVARMEAGKLTIDPSIVPISRLMSDVLEMMTPLAAARSLTLEALPVTDLPPIYADLERAVQVFSNLIGNAIKFTPAGGRVVIKAERAGPVIRFSVVDSGPGIPSDQLPNVFGRFWQARQSDRRGIGLGLTIARSIVEAHSGRIGVESTFGEGTEFWFTLPIVDTSVSSK